MMHWWQYGRALELHAMMQGQMAVNSVALFARSIAKGKWSYWNFAMV